MTDHFNKLNPEEHELLTKIIEESSEVIKAGSKILLHGMDSHEPGQSYPNNKDKLQNEIGDLLYFIALACNRGLLNADEIHDALQARSDRPNQYLHHTYIPQE